MKKEFGVIILAAGKSSRLGRPKQSLVYKGGTLLNELVKKAVALDCGPVVVVLGADADYFTEDCKNVFTVINEKWQEGMASSIRAGVDSLQKIDSGVSGAIVSVCDQPYVTKELLQELVEKHLQTDLPIIASNYGEATGTPAFFHKSVFSELMQLKGDKGAKGILQKDKERVGLINFPLGNVDIDTEEDYTSLLKNESK